MLLSETDIPTRALIKPLLVMPPPMELEARVMPAEPPLMVPVDALIMDPPTEVPTTRIPDIPALLLVVINPLLVMPPDSIDGLAESPVARPPTKLPIPATAIPANAPEIVPVGEFTIDPPIELPIERMPAMLLPEIKPLLVMPPAILL